jgi:type I site-specific restriction endonuclease
MRTAVKSADIVFYHKPNMPLVVIEAKANKHEIGKGMQQGLDYACLLEVPFIFAFNASTTLAKILRLSWFYRSTTTVNYPRLS